MDKEDGRKNNHGTKGHKGGPGRPPTPSGARPRHMYTAFPDEDALIRSYIKIVKSDFDKAKRILES